MLNLMRLGVIPFGTALLSQVSNEYPELGTPDIAGLNPDMPTMRRVVAAYTAPQGQPHQVRPRHHL